MWWNIIHNLLSKPRYWKDKHYNFHIPVPTCKKTTLAQLIVKKQSLTVSPGPGWGAVPPKECNFAAEPKY